MHSFRNEMSESNVYVMWSSWIRTYILNITDTFAGVGYLMWLTLFATFIGILLFVAQHIYDKPTNRAAFEIPMETAERCEIFLVENYSHIAMQFHMEIIILRSSSHNIWFYTKWNIEVSYLFVFALIILNMQSLLCISYKS